MHLNSLGNNKNFQCNFRVTQIEVISTAVTGCKRFQPEHSNAIRNAMHECRSMTHLPVQGNTVPNDLNQLRYFWYHHMPTE